MADGPVTVCVPHPPLLLFGFLVLLERRLLRLEGEAEAGLHRSKVPSEQRLWEAPPPALHRTPAGTWLARWHMATLLGQFVRALAPLEFLIALLPGGDQHRTVFGRWRLTDS